MGPDDVAGIEEGFARLSERSRYLRFFSGVNRLSSHQLRSFTDIDQVEHVAVAALVPGHPDAPDPDDGLGVGVARYAPDRPGETAELAVAVTDDHHGRGIGTLLVQALARIAAERGLGALTALTLSENTAMRGVLEHCGAHTVKRRPDEDFAVVRYELPVGVALERAGPARRELLDRLLPWP